MAAATVTVTCEESQSRELIQISSSVSCSLFSNNHQQCDMHVLRDSEHFLHCQQTSRASDYTESEHMSHLHQPPTVDNTSPLFENSSFSLTSQDSLTSCTDLQNRETYQVAAKIILLGDYHVGKTRFLRTLSRANIEDGSVSCREYRLAELVELVFQQEDKKVMVRVMDTGGQERYRSLTSSYYRGVHGCIFMFDVKREETFNNIITWYQDLQKYSTDHFVSAILVGVVPDIAGERSVSWERGFKLAESLAIPYVEYSPQDQVKSLAIVHSLKEKIAKVSRRKISLKIEIKPQTIGNKKLKKQGTCAC